MKHMSKSISKDELNSLLSQNDKIFIIDVRTDEEYRKKHIPNAINIPIDEIESRIRSMDSDTTYVTACGKGGGRSEQGASILSEMGYKAFFLEGGTFGWFGE